MSCLIGIGIELGSCYDLFLTRREKNVESRSTSAASQAFLWVIVLWAAANAVSYFVRSDGWGNLVGQSPQNRQAIGAPWLVWQEGGPLGAAGQLALVGNVAVGLLSAAGASFLVVRFPALRRLLPSSPGESEAEGVVSHPGRALQFRIRTLLGLVVVEAVILGGIRSYGDARPALLAAIYLLGPSVLLAVAWRLRDVIPAHRNAAIALVGFLFVPAAAVLGESIDGIRDFTRGLLGLFVCWVPQCVVLAGGFLIFRRLGVKEGDRSMFSGDPCSPKDLADRKMDQSP